VPLDPAVRIVLEEFPSVIAINPKKPEITDLVEFQVEVENEKPIFVQPRKMHPDKQAIIDKKVDEMRRNGIVSPVKFPESLTSED